MRAARDFGISLAIHFAVFLLSAWLSVKPLFLSWIAAGAAYGVAVTLIGFLEGRIRPLAVRPFYGGLVASVAAALLGLTLFEMAAASPQNELSTSTLFLLGFEAFVKATSLLLLTISTSFAIIASAIGFLIGRQTAGNLEASKHA